MKLIFKFLGGVAGLLSSGCIIGSPIVIYSSQRGYSNRLEGGEASTIEKDNKTTQKLNFQDLWEKIDSEYKRNNLHAQELGLPGKDELEKIIVTQDRTSKIGALEKQDWKSCIGEGRAIETFCGFLYLTNSNVEYKLKIALGDDTKWRVIVVKYQDKKIYYYRQESSNWQEKLGIDFAKLFSYKNWSDTGDNNGYKFSENSIKS